MDSQEGVTRLTKEQLDEFVAECWPLFNKSRNPFTMEVDDGLRGEQTKELSGSGEGQQARPPAPEHEGETEATESDG